MHKIKELALKWKLNNRHNENVIHENIGFDKASTVGILFYEDIDFSILENFVKKIKIDKKSVKVLVYTSEVKNIETDLEITIFNKKDISLLGEILNREVKRFAEFNFDYLFCTYNEPFPAFDMILQKSRAKCRVGIYNVENANNFELMIEKSTNNDLETTLNQLLYYVKVMEN